MEKITTDVTDVVNQFRPQIEAHKPNATYDEVTKELRKITSAVCNHVPGMEITHKNGIWTAITVQHVAVKSMVHFAMTMGIAGWKTTA